MSILSIFSIIISIVIYGLICYYIGFNGWAWLKSAKFAKYKKSYVTSMVFLSLSIFIGIYLPYAGLQWISGFWMAILGYSFIVLPIANIVHFLLKKKQVFWIGIAVLSFYLFIFIYGSYNAWVPVVKTYDIQVNKTAQNKNLKIFMASDLHLGQMVGKSHLDRLISLIHQEKPDIVLLPGDIINDNIQPYLEKNMGETLGKIDAPLGVYAVLGNHDYYGNDKDAILAEMDNLGIRVLMDEYVLINDFYLIGRKEHTDKTRKVLSTYLKGLDATRPMIMMDHQPKDLKEAELNGIDLLLSGHTHKGQLAPANLLTDLIYENDYGYLKKGSMHSLVSSGFGLWGPPIRIGSQAEVMVINVHFKDKQKGE
ncbi:metallophosphoesterase [Bacillus sp. T3]|uniref:metallophosphoesterase n=1 Tax=Bacillus sp. T3 TaxID=467262 RepID=UPI002981E8EB|nr:metallophosphoesterase [Bacillus sp. T3]